MKLIVMTIPIDNATLLVSEMCPSLRIKLPQHLVPMGSQVLRLKDVIDIRDATSPVKDGVYQKRECEIEETTKKRKWDDVSDRYDHFSA